jgi:TM2 domain-containing membrane protein YozV
LAIALTAGCWAYCCASPDDDQTYPSETGLMSLQAEQHSSPLSAQRPQDPVTHEKVDSIRLRDPNYAIFVALVPGAVVHGAGHFYAGKPGTGTALFVSEVTGLGLCYLGAMTAMGSGEYSTGGVVAVSAGLALFIGSWAYDVALAPLSIKKENEKLLPDRQTRLELRLKNGDVRLVTVFRF